MSHIYFVSVGYSKEFHGHVRVKGSGKAESGTTAKEEIQQRQKMCPRDRKVYVEGKLQTWGEDKILNQIQDEDENLMDNLEDPSSASTFMPELGMMLKKLEEIIQSKIVNALEEHKQSYSVKCEDSWQIVLMKVVEKYEEDNKRLKEQNNELTTKLIAATESSQLYRNLLHEGIF
ncbi:OLC1v1034181C2 [Oldenlandia corymbosa var. corymbosa]|nr:OLC1v1034181C2 [Oldenlandia corymbosa var. corymbosa]